MDPNKKNILVKINCVLGNHFSPFLHPALVLYYSLFFNLLSSFSWVWGWEIFIKINNYIQFFIVYCTCPYWLSKMCDLTDNTMQQFQVNFCSHRCFDGFWIFLYRWIRIFGQKQNLTCSSPNLRENREKSSFSAVFQK